MHAINHATRQSLFVLGRVIEDLNAGRGRVPFRDSKLTRLLQDSLGGSASAVMVCCVSPSSAQRQDTLQALSFAFRTRAVQNIIRAAPPRTAKKTADDVAALQERLAAWRLSKGKQHLYQHQARRVPSTPATTRPNRTALSALAAPPANTPQTPATTTSSLLASAVAAVPASCSKVTPARRLDGRLAFVAAVDLSPDIAEIEVRRLSPQDR